MCTFIKNLTSMKVWIEEDFSPRVREARRKLREYGKPFRSAETRVRLSFDKLFIGDQAYYYDPVSDRIIELNRDSVPSKGTGQKPYQTSAPNTSTGQE